MKKPALFLGALCALIIGLPSIAAAKKAAVTVVNKSDWQIHQFFLSPVDTDEWGPDQLGDQVIGTGDSFKLTDIDCSSYDVKLVDEDEDECVVGGVDICGSGQTWTITSDDLLDCQVATEEGDEE